MTQTFFLIVNSRGVGRLRKSRPGSRELGINECAFRISVEIPEARRIIGEIHLTLPPPPDAGIEVSQEIYDALVPVPDTTETP